MPHVPADLVGLDALRRSPAWRTWGALAAPAPPYLAPELFALMAPLVHGAQILVATAGAPEHLVGALPLIREGDRLRALRSDHTPKYDYCGDTAGLAAIWERLRRDPGWTEIVLDRVPASSLLATELPALARADRCPAVVRPDTRHLYLALPGFEAAMNAKFRVNLHRCARKAGDLLLERIVVPTHADLEAAAAIEALGWKGAAGTAIAADPRVVHLYEALGRLLGRRGRVSLYFLRVAGRRVATLFAIEDAHTLYALKIGHDPHVASLSPGHLLVWKVAADAEQRGLVELDFVGHEDDWKRKWTTTAHEHVAVILYQRSLRGLTRYARRERIQPRLPAQLRETPRSPFPRRCQRSDILGQHSLVERALGRLAHGFGIRSGVRRMLQQAPARRERLGVASKYPVGSWVRVLDPARLAGILDAQQRGRGLPFVSTQWETCGQVYQVARHVRRLRDDHGRYRPVQGTVLLAGVDCAGHHATRSGCGRHCPLMYRDEWLEPATSPHHAPRPAAHVRHARVRGLDEIYATLDAFGRRDGLTFMPQMAAYAAKRFPLASELASVYEHDRWTAPGAPIYILGGLHCDGAIASARGPCDRACALMWHADWLMLEPAAT